MWNCLWGHAFKRSPGINRKSRVSYPSPGFLSSATWPSLPKKHYNGLKLDRMEWINWIYLINKFVPGKTPACRHTWSAIQRWTALTASSSASSVTSDSPNTRTGVITWSITMDTARRNPCWIKTSCRWPSQLFF